MQSLRQYTRRDSATAFLRKLGVSKSSYNDFITKDDEGLFWVDVEEAEKSLNPAKSTVAKDQPKVEPKAKSKPSEVKSEAAVEKETVTSVSRQLIKDGKTNKEVWDVIKAKFSLDDSKKSYPAWYRSQMKRDGKLK